MRSLAIPANVDVLLIDGAIAQIRPVRPEDETALQDLYERLSDRTLYLRFFTAARTSAAQDIAKLIRMDPDRHTALQVVLAGRLVAVAGYERLDDPTEAEVAFVVDDSCHGLGIGTLLLEHLASTAAAHGIQRFVAETLVENARMLHVFRDAGLPVTTHSEGYGAVRVELPLAPDEHYLQVVGDRERTAGTASLARVLAPTSVVVAGAGANPDGLGHQVLANLVAGGYTGILSAVNRSGETVCDTPTYPTLADVPGRVDVVVVAVPASGVLEVARAAAARNAAGLVVITSGFAEAGPAGAADQAELLSICRAGSMRLIGPNCMGIANTAVAMNATFCATLPPAGGLSLMSQSGAVGIAALDYATRTGVGMSSFVSAGNKADVSGNDLLAFWESDPATRVCALYLESFGNPRKFARVAARVGRHKPVVAVKSGRSVSGSRGVASHTAAAATPDIAVDSLFTQAGVIRVDSLAELFEVATLLDVAPLPAGRRVAIIGNSGGPGVLAADACEAAGLLVPALEPQTRERVAALLPDGMAVANPVDLLAGADAATFEAALHALLDDPTIDAVITVYTPVRPGSADGIAVAIARCRARHLSTPIVAVFLGLETMPAALRDDVGRPTVPYHAFPEPAARALAAATRYVEWRDRPAGTAPVLEGIDRHAARQLVDAALATDGGWLDASVAAQLVATYGIDVAPVVVVTSAEEAAAAAVRIHGPVALKAAAGALVHKTDRGGVRVGLVTPADVREAYTEMAARLGDDMGGAVVQPMVDPGVETAIGVVSDPQFGPLVMFGLGGVASDLLADRAFRLLPLTVEDAAAQVRSLRAAPLLFGYRGAEPCDVSALEDMLLRVAALADDFPEIAELDLNPVVSTPDGATAVDVKIRLTAAEPTFPLLRRLR
jgi:acyl-CoA synthetase (NDP forming)/GNAT superfamily N-acetyltransferase